MSIYNKWAGSFFKTPCLLFNVFENITIYNRIHWFYDFGIQMLGILIVVFTRVNGYIEIIFAILVCSYLYMIERHFAKEKSD